jgi:hypothetical protein
MSQALDTVADYIADARVLLQDAVAPYRYGDSELVENLNRGLLEMRRLRPDLMISYFNGSIPKYASTSQSTNVDCDVQYRIALLYYICGQAQLRDEEATQDARATVFINKFTAQLLTIEA